MPSRAHKKSIVYSQALRLKRNCTFEKAFHGDLVNMKEMAKEQMKCAFFGKTDKTRKGSTKGVPFVVTFNRKLTLLAKKNIELSKYLGIGLEVKNAFTTTPMVSFRSARKIRDYLLSAIRYPLERNVGSRKYSKSS